MSTIHVHLKVTRQTMAFIIAVLGAFSTWVSDTYGNVGLAALAIAFIGSLIVYLTTQEDATAAGAGVLPARDLAEWFLIGAIVIYGAMIAIELIAYLFLHVNQTWIYWEEGLGLIFGTLFLLIGMYQKGEL